MSGNNAGSGSGSLPGPTETEPEQTRDAQASARGLSNKRQPTNLFEFAPHDTCAVCDAQGHVARYCHMVDKETGFLAHREGTDGHGCANCNSTKHELDNCMWLDRSEDEALTRRIRLQLHDRARRPPIRSKVSWLEVARRALLKIDNMPSKNWRGFTRDNLFKAPDMHPLTRAWCMARVKDMEVPFLHAFDYGWDFQTELIPDFSLLATDGVMEGGVEALEKLEAYIGVPAVKSKTESQQLAQSGAGFNAVIERLQVELASSKEAMRVCALAMEQHDAIKAQAESLEEEAKRANDQTKAVTGAKRTPFGEAWKVARDLRRAILNAKREDEEEIPVVFGARRGVPAANGARRGVAYGGSYDLM